MTPIEQRIGLDEGQFETLKRFEELLLEVNRRHNLVSEASAGDFRERHVRHCLALATRRFPAGCTVVDWGTGGGLPAIPLAVAFPEVRFVAVDSVGKKVRAVELMARRLGLENLEAWHGRAEEWPGRAHYAVSRATAPLADLWRWTIRVIEPVGTGSEDWPPGLLALKGGALDDEIAGLKAEDASTRVTTHQLEPIIGDGFREKLIVHVAEGDQN